MMQKKKEKYEKVVQRLYDDHVSGWLDKRKTKATIAELDNFFKKHSKLSRINPYIVSITKEWIVTNRADKIESGIQFGLDSMLLLKTETVAARVAQLTTSLSGIKKTRKVAKGREKRQLRSAQVKAEYNIALLKVWQRELEAGFKVLHEKADGRYSLVTPKKARSILKKLKQKARGKK